MTNKKKFSACRRLRVKVRLSNEDICPVLTVCQSSLIQKRLCIATGQCAKPAQSTGEKSDKESKGVRSSPWVLQDHSLLLLYSSSRFLFFFSLLLTGEWPITQEKVKHLAVRCRGYILHFYIVSLPFSSVSVCVHCWTLCCSFAVEDEESTIEEQEATEVAADQKAELAELTKEGTFYISDVRSCL